MLLRRKQHSKQKEGTDKYKGKLPFKCFNCGRIGLFASKFTFQESLDNNKREKFKRNLYSKKRRTCSSTNEDHDNSNDETVIMTLKVGDKKTNVEKFKANKDNEKSIIVWT